MLFDLCSRCRLPILTSETEIDPPPHPTDLSAETQDSDFGDGLADVWRRHGEQLRRRARTRLRQYGLAGHAESMDICNDVMADLARRRSRDLPTAGASGTIASDSPDEVLRYILKAIDHQVLDTFRTLARQCRDFRRNETSPVEELRLSAGEGSPSRLAVRREVIQWVRSHLDAGDARAIDMMIEGYDWNEIGRELKLAPDTARMRVRRAIDRARRTLQSESND